MKSQQEEVEEKAFKYIEELISDKKTLSILEKFDPFNIKKTEDVISVLCSFFRSNGIANSSKQEKEIKDLIDSSKSECMQCKVNESIMKMKIRILSKTTHEQLKEIMNLFEQSNRKIKGEKNVK